MEIITSRQNPRFKEIKKLTDDKKFRAQSGTFFVDGVNFVAQAIENNWDVETLVYVPTEIDSEFKREVLSRVAPEKHFPIGADLYKILSTKNDIQGVGAVIRQKWLQNTVEAGVGVVLENIANPGNLGSIMRLCAAFGIADVYTIAPAVELFHPEVVRASMGAIFQLNLIEFDSLEVMKQKLSENPRHCIGTSLQDDAINISEYKGKKFGLNNNLIWFGSEAKGLSDGAKKLCQTLVKIPISSAVDSLNVAESASIVLYELLGKNYE